MVSRKLLITTNIVALLLSGCSVKYQCETTKTGVCASVEDTYEAVYASDGSEAAPIISSPTGKSFPVSPVFPLRQPEQVYRIWIKDYEDESGLLVSNHYIYVVVEGKWLVGDKPKKKVISEIDYDEKIKNYLIQKGKIKPREEDDEDYDEDI